MYLYIHTQTHTFHHLKRSFYIKFNFLEMIQDCFYNDHEWFWRKITHMTWESFIVSPGYQFPQRNITFFFQFCVYILDIIMYIYSAYRHNIPSSIIFFLYYLIHLSYVFSEDFYMPFKRYLLGYLNVCFLFLKLFMCDLHKYFYKISRVPQGRHSSHKSTK